jgi:hypothetical protein
MEGYCSARSQQIRSSLTVGEVKGETCAQQSKSTGLAGCGKTARPVGTRRSPQRPKSARHVMGVGNT